MVQRKAVDTPTSKWKSVAFIDRIHSSEQWKALLEKRGWTDDYRTGDDAAKFVAYQEKQTASTLDELGL